MRPSKSEDDAIVDLLDVLLRDGVVVEADVIISVAEVPLVGVKLRAAIAGMTAMAEYGMFEKWDRQRRTAGAEGAPVDGGGERRAGTARPRRVGGGEAPGAGDSPED